MLKALFKKQFLELHTYYFRNNKTGKNRSKAGTILLTGLFALLFVYLGVVFFGVGKMIGEPLIAAGCGWLYWALMGLIALALGVFGSVFNTYAGLFHAKDNELLLSMPIPPSRILLVRLTGVYAMGLLYEALVMVPTAIVWWIAAPSVSVLTVILQLLLILLLGLVILTLTCALGWVVALISGRLKNKSLITVLLTLVFIAVYYLVYFRINTFLQGLLADVENVSARIRKGLFPVYAFGKAGEGDVLAWLAFAVLAIALCALCYVVMSRTFLRIATANRGEKKSAYKEKPLKTAGIRSALLRKELCRFKSSPTYMLNCGLGIILLPAVAVFAIIRMDTVRGMLEGFAALEPSLAEWAPLAVAALIGMMNAMNTITAPSVSLEGKSLWLLQSLPVEPWDALQAKLNLHLCLSAAPAAVAAVLLSVVIRADYALALYTVVIALLFVQFSGELGLVLNLKKPNLSWTNETVVVKQSLAVLLTLFGLWAVAIAMAALYFLLRNMLSVSTYMLIWIILLALSNRLLLNWLKKQGSRIFAEL